MQHRSILVDSRGQPSEGVENDRRGESVEMKMAGKYTLLRSQGRVFEMLREVGLEPADFSWLEKEVGRQHHVSRLGYRECMYYFQFSWCEPMVPVSRARQTPRDCRREGNEAFMRTGKAENHAADGTARREHRPARCRG
jgi:hypothetical protein